MKPFLNADFLLGCQTAKTLYHGFADKMPILDYHCHINPQEIADDARYDTITALWLGGDHYKWRAMRSAGLPERCITGDAEPAEKFLAWADTVPKLIGNPLYHWTHLELQRYFGIDEPLSGRNAMAVYRACNERLQQPDMSVRGLIEKSRVQLICTTDDPVDDLGAHARIAADPSCAVRVLPAFRPDKALRADKPGFAAYLERLEAVTGKPIGNVNGLRDALLSRIAYFDAHGCRVSDHALDTALYASATEAELNDILQKGRQGAALSRHEAEAFQTALLLTLARAYKARGWVMQWHFGCIRDNSTIMFQRLGPDTGYDAMNDEGGNARRLAQMLDLLEREDALPRTILYSLNPADNAVIATVMGCFQTDSDIPGRIQMGSAWWFNDHRRGMERQLEDLMSLGVVASFVGMLTDSRSFLSYTRHEYFRRILCNLFGGLVENGEYPADIDTLGGMVKDICYHNALRYFRFDEILSEEMIKA
jgi:glucuronate isomerase